MRLSIRLLGGFYAAYDDQPIKPLYQARLQSLLAYLLLQRGHPLPRRQLAFAFWPDSTEKQALNNLRTILYRLRNNLPEADKFLELERHTVSWRKNAPFTFDVAQFEEALDEAFAAERANQEVLLRDALEQATAIYRGDLLPAIYEAWIKPHREGLRQAYSDAVEKLVDLLAKAGAYTEAITHARCLVQLKPLNESAYQLLMCLQLDGGERTGALQTFEQGQKMLAEELGVDPSPKTLKLHLRALQGEIGLGSEQRDEQARQVARQREELNGQYERLIEANVLLLELQREREEKKKLLERLANSPAGEGAASEELDDRDIDDVLELSCPYKGLAAYEEEDEAYFFGREAVVAELCARLAGTLFLSVVGPSGSGKSSVIRAGLLPALREGCVPGSASWKTAVFTPGAQPLASLALATSQFSDTNPGKFYAQLREDKQALAKALCEAEEEDQHWLVVVDQFEELFALCYVEDERRQFIDNLLQAVEACAGRLRLILTMRADFYGRCADYPTLAAAQKDSFLLGPLEKDGLCQIIDEPAALAGLRLEPGLADTIMDDVVGEPGALPLLSHTLFETWKRREGRTLTLAGYRASGGISGAIAQTADSVYKRLTPQQQTLTRRIFLRLTELAEDGIQDTRRRVAPGEFVLHEEDEAPVAAVLKKLVDARLITTGENTVEVAHEALIREWPQLRQWLEEDRQGLRIHRHLTETALAWAALDRDPGELYRGARLATASEWAGQYGRRMNSLEQEFVQASQALARRREEEREAQLQKEIENARRLEVEVEQKAEAQARAEDLRLLATSRELAATARINLDRDPELGLLLAIQALRTTKTREAVDALHRALSYPVVERTLFGHTGGDMTDVMYMADGSHLFTAGRDGLVRLWDIASGEVLRTFSGHTADVSKFTLNKDETRLATAGADSVAKVWDVETGEELLSLEGHNLWVFGVAFSPDGKRLATAGEDGLIKIWDLTSGEDLMDLDHHQDFINEISYTPDGSQLITASNDGTVKIWDAATGQELASLSGHEDGVFGMAFSPDWTLMVTESFDQTIKIWDLTQIESAGNDAVLFTLARKTDRSGNATRIVFSPDGRRILEPDSDSHVSEWDVASGRLLRRIPCSSGTIFTIAVSPDGEHLAVADEFGRAKIWSLLPAGELLELEFADAVYDVQISPDGSRLFTSAGSDGMKVWNFDRTNREVFGQLIGAVDVGEAGAFFKAAVSQDGSKVAVAGADGVIRVLDSSSFEEVLVLSGHDRLVSDAAFNRDGTRLATTSLDMMFKIWDLEAGGALCTMDHHKDSIVQVVFSPDDQYLVTASYDRTARVWNAETGKPLLVLDLGIKVRALAFSPDGETLAVGSGTGLSLYDFKGWVKDGEMRELAQLAGHTGAIISANFSPSGRYLASGGADKQSRVWDVATGQTLNILAGGDNWVRDVAFSLDESLLIVAGADGKIRVYYLEPDKLLEVAQARITRWFTAEECREFLNLEVCPPAPWEA